MIKWFKKENLLHEQLKVRFRQRQITHLYVKTVARKFSIEGLCVCAGALHLYGGLTF